MDSRNDRAARNVGGNQSLTTDHTDQGPDLRGYVSGFFGALAFVALARFAVALEGEGGYEFGSTLGKTG